jgi:hypothetical protein
MTETVTQVLHKVMKDIQSIGKSDFNDFHKFNFRGIDTVLEKVGPAFREHGIVVMPELRNIDSLELVSKDGKRKRSVTLTVAYTFHGPAGDCVTAVVPGEANDTEDKASSKAMSVAFRTALLQVLAVPTNERDPHAGPPVTTAMARLRARASVVMKDRGWTNEQIAAEYFEWSQGAEIGAAEEADLEKFLRTVEPKKTMQRGPS